MDNLKRFMTLNDLSDDDILFNWSIGIGEKGFYSLSSVALPLFGDVPEFNLKEIYFMINEFDKTDKSFYEVSKVGAIELKNEIIKKYKIWKQQMILL